MSITAEYAKIPSNSDLNLDFPVFDQSKLRFNGTETDRNGVVKTTYELADGNPNHRVTVTVSCGTDKAGVRRMNIRYSADLIETDSIAETERVGWAGEFGIFLNVAPHPKLTVAEVESAVRAIIGLTLTAGGVVADTHIADLCYGVTTTFG